MKKLINYFRIVLLAVIISSVVACAEDDSDKQWGYAKVYMPQASLLNGGLSNTYPVPFGESGQKNYTIDKTTNKLKVVLGVYRSGLQALESFSVNVGVDNAKTASEVAITSKGVALPSDVYSLPEKITVENGHREKVFYLEVDINKIIETYPTYNKNKMVLVVEISNPSNYELNEKLAKTTVVIEGSTFLPAPPIVKGGDFEVGNENYWTGFLKNNTGTVIPGTDAGIANGELFFDYGEAKPTGEIFYYTEVEMEQGLQYKFSCDIKSVGGTSVTNCRFYLVLRRNNPESGFTYNAADNTFFIYLDAWNGMAKPINGTLPQNGGWQERIDRTTGLFTADFTGKGYIVIGVGAWSSPIGKITIDNVKMVEI